MGPVWGWCVASVLPCRETNPASTQPALTRTLYIKRVIQEAAGSATGTKFGRRYE